MHDTIFALTSGSLPSSVAVVRLSGSMVPFIIEELSGSVPLPRQAVYRTFKTSSGKIIDKGLLLYFQSPNSFTGENVAEFHIHGSKATVACLLSELSQYKSLRHAQAGEFTKRAFFNGKLDLTEVEALSDLVAAETEAQRRFALKNLEGAQTRIYTDWRQRVLDAQALLEAEIDFSDQDDVSSQTSENLSERLHALTEEIFLHIKGIRRAEIIQDGYEVILVGTPNAGKSSLLNYLSGRDIAIVSSEPGTTRDFIETNLNLNGIKVCFVDTAGLRVCTGVENLGVERAKKRAKQADLVLELRDITSDAQTPLEVKSDFIVGSKCDLPHQGSSDYDFLISSVTGEGIEVLLKEIEVRAHAAVGFMGDVLPSRLRHTELLSSGREFILQATHETEIDLKAELLRNAADKLSCILGKINIEDVLDSIFSKFCIGK